MGIYPVETITEIQHYLQQLQHGSNLDAYQQKAKAAVVHMYNGILLSYKKEHIQVSPNEVDEFKVYYTG